MIFFGGKDKNSALAPSTNIIHGSTTNPAPTYQSSFFVVSFGVESAAKPLSGERGVGGNGPKAGVPTPGAGQPSVAAIAGVRNAPPPVPLDGPDSYKLGESPSPAGVPGMPAAPPDEVPPERRHSGRLVRGVQEHRGARRGAGITRDPAVG